VVKTYSWLLNNLIVWHQLPTNINIDLLRLNSAYIKRHLAQPFVDQTTRYSIFDGMIGDMQTLAVEGWEITEQRFDQIDYGEASFNGRSVDALQVELKIASKIRLVVKYSEYCHRIHAIKDGDFEMWHDIAVTDCTNEAATS
jgi:hypothetical protein